MPESLNVIALISGGKDSFYSILHCLHHGHKVVALANLCPPGQEDGTTVDDMDSMTYQTVGSKVIPLYQRCVGIPVFQQPIAGITVCDQQDYSRPGQKGPVEALDETEDLFNLLSDIKTTIPWANAVSSGAILSTYQRTRVESVVVRLGMTPLACLWQYPFLPPPPERADSATGLLDDMNAAGCDARLIKIASYNIKPSMLNKNIADSAVVEALARSFRRGNVAIDDESEFRAAVLGEGGEYETLTVNGPRLLWQNRIDWQPNRLVEDAGAVFKVDDYPDVVAQTSDSELPQSHGLRIPAQWDSHFHDCGADHVDLPVSANGTTFDDEPPSTGHIWKSGQKALSPDGVDGTQLFAISSDHISVSNITAAVRPTSSSLSTGSGRDHGNATVSQQLMRMSASQQMEAISAAVRLILSTISKLLGDNDPKTCLGVSNVTSTMLLLSSMDDFSSVNVEYASLFSEINPPARCTFATALPDAIKVSVNITIDMRSAQRRRALHVQSRSYWAPANIGPYSQAVAEPMSTIRSPADDSPISRAELVSFAGQIPLVPITMGMMHGSPRECAALSLQHLWRVAQERKVDLWPWAVAFIANSQSSRAYTEAAFQVWRRAHAGHSKDNVDTDADLDDDYDVWDVINNRAQAGEATKKTASHIHTLPNWDAMRGGTAVIPPVIAAEVLQLPRNAPIEWWSTGLGRLPKGSGASVLKRDCELCNISLKNMAYDTLEYEANGNESGTSFITAFVRYDSKRTTEEDREHSDAFSRLFQHTHGARRRIVSGHCLIAGSVGERLYKELADEAWMRGLAVVPCVSLTYGHLSESSSVEAAALVLLIRTEEHTGFEDAQSLQCMEIEQKCHELFKAGSGQVTG